MKSMKIDLGVGTSNCELRPMGRPHIHLFGDDENSWALCVSRASRVLARHKGQSCDMEDLSGKLVESPMLRCRGLDSGPKTLVFSFLISASGQMLVTLPGHSEEIVVPFEIPQDFDVFVVASVAAKHPSRTI